VTVYLDVLFAVNLLMNGIVLACMKLCLRERMTWLRWGLASAVGAGLYCLAIFLPLHEKRWIVGIYFVLAAAIMVQIAFAVKGKLKKWAAYVAVQYLTASILGGLMNGILYGLRTEAPAETAFRTVSGAERTWNTETEEFFLTAIAAVFLFFIGYRFLFHRKQKEENRYKVFLRLGQKSATLDALLDTGNSLLEPTSRFPVIIGDMQGVHKLLDEEELEQIREFYQTGNYTGEKKIRLVPYHAVGVDTGILLAYLLDEVVMVREKGEAIHKKGIYLGISPVCICTDKSYQILLHPWVLEEGTQIQK